MDSQDYFEQTNVWSESPERYQLQVAKDIAAMIPKGVATVLDVGTGNGLITQRLPANLYCVGLDQSHTALTRNPAIGVMGTANRLPFADDSFDLVMSTDMLEHMADFGTAIAEMARVSRRYVVVTVPYAEDLEAKLTWCEHCCTSFHINHHLRSFDVPSLRSALTSAGQLLEMRLSGGVGRPLPDSWVALRREVGAYIAWEGSRCPTCGRAGTAGFASESQRATLDAARSISWWQHILSTGAGEDRSEIVCLVDVGRSAPNTSAAHLPQTAKTPAPTELLEAVTAPLLAVDLRTQPAVTEFVVGQRLPSHRRVEVGGENSVSYLELCWPLGFSTGDLICVAGSQSSSIQVAAIDGVLGHTVELERVATLNNGYEQFRLAQAVAATQFGGLVRIEASDIASVESVELMPRGQQGPLAQLVQLGAGDNLVAISRDGVQFSWSLWVEQPALVPDPRESLAALAVSWASDHLSAEQSTPGPGLTAAVETALSVGDALSEMLIESRAQIAALELGRSQLEETLQGKDRSLLSLEQDLDVLQVTHEQAMVERATQIDRLNSLANELEAKRSALEAMVVEKDVALRELEAAASKSRFRR